MIAETEFWPNFLRLAKRGGARIAVINCRISDRSFPDTPLHFWLPKVLANGRFVSDTNRRRSASARSRSARLQQRPGSTGNLKFDVAPPSVPAIVASLRAALGDSCTDTAAGWPILVCGSTLEDEEAPLLSAFHNILATHPKAVMILAPRHPERFAEVAALVENLGIRMSRRSLWSGEPLAGAVLLLDTIGELAALYSLATVAFVGGSLVPRGGHNILEPARYGVPIITGNHYENFRDIVNFFLSRNAVRVVGLAELPLVFMELIGNEVERTTLGHNALAALDSQRGATTRTINALVELMNGPAADTHSPGEGAE